MPRVGFYDDPVFREHDSGPGHPERPERLEAVRRGVARFEGRLELLRPRPATPEELGRVHSDDHLRRVAETEGRTVCFDADTQAGPRSYAAALLAAGAVVDAVERVLEGRLDRAFCAVRPPGHHACPSRAMGFCLLNNVAVGAAHALARGLERVLIVDWDVHHGNGTQAAFIEDPCALYVSSHAFPSYPGTGSLAETGRAVGEGFTVNLPLPTGLGDAEYARVYRDLVEPIGRAFDPQLVLVSAGFDPHASDPLGGMALSERGFAELTRVCMDLAGGAAEGRVVVALEGGYDLQAIEVSTAEVVRGLLGEPRDRLEAARTPRLERLVAAYRERLAPHWPMLGE